MQIFYSTNINDDQVSLTEQEAQHCKKVLRHVIGDTIYVMDGAGGLYESVITSISQNDVHAEILEKKVFEKPKSLPHLAFGIIKNTTRLEWMIEKVTEIGVHTIQPLICARSEKRHIKEQRLLKIILSAAKQSKQFHLPKLFAPKKIENYLSEVEKGLGYVAHYKEGQQDLWEHHTKRQSATFLIGPEGDFTSEEFQLSVDKGFIPVNLGKSRLRAETAAIVACTHLNV